jgi:hypothetical protein
VSIDGQGRGLAMIARRRSAMPRSARYNPARKIHSVASTASATTLPSASADQPYVGFLGDIPTAGVC